MTPRCPECSAPLMESVVNFDDLNVSLHFLVCEGCRNISLIGLDVVKGSLADLKVYEAVYLSESLDRYLDTMKIVPSSSKRLQVLDVGSWPGYLTRMLSKVLGYEMHGLDYHLTSDISSRNQLQPYVTIMAQSGIVVKECDIDRDPFPFNDGTFDLILLEEVIEHLHNPQHTLDEIHRILKINGKLVVTTPNYMRLANRLKSFVGKSPKLTALRAHVKEYTVKELKELMISANLQVEKVMFKDWRERRWLKFYRKEKNAPRIAWSIARLAILKIFPSLSSCLLIISKKQTTAMRLSYNSS